MYSLIPIACARACFQLVQSSYLLNASLTVHGFDFSPLDDYRIRDSTIVGAQVGSYLHTHIHTPSVMATVLPSPSYPRPLLSTAPWN